MKASYRETNQDYNLKFKLIENLKLETFKKINRTIKAISKALYHHLLNKNMIILLMRNKDHKKQKMMSLIGFIHQ